MTPGDGGYERTCPGPDRRRATHGAARGQTDSRDRRDSPALLTPRRRENGVTFGRHAVLVRSVPG